MERRKRHRLILLALLLCLSIGLYRSFSGSSTDGDGHFSAADFGANATLGFGAIVAVSRQGSPRQQSLVRAANITELEITVPLQPVWTNADLARLKADKDSKITRGSALAWLGHLNALQWFLDSSLETMLVLEDDVDWDIHIRNTQIPAAAAAIRQLVQDQTSPPGETDFIPKQANFWGKVGSWDLLYLGHCGDIFRIDEWHASIPQVTYSDPTLPRYRDLHAYTRKFLDMIDVKEYTRIIHKSIFPLCTFAFAITRPAASRLLHEIAAREADGGTMAYDVRVLEACRDLGFRCWSANPELFHHMDLESEIAAQEIKEDGSGAALGKSEAEPVKVETIFTGKAANIACGARSNQYLMREELDLEVLREKVGRLGMCLRDPDEVIEEEEPYRPYEGPGDPRMWPPEVSKR